MMPFLCIKLKNYLGNYSRVSLASKCLFDSNLLNGTNFTISDYIYDLYFLLYKGTKSASRASMAVKSASPTPTITIERGREDP